MSRHVLNICQKFKIAIKNKILFSQFEFNLNFSIFQFWNDFIRKKSAHAFQRAKKTSNHKFTYDLFVNRQIESFHQPSYLLPLDHLKFKLNWKNNTIYYQLKWIANLKLSNWHQKFYQVFRRKVARSTVAASHRHRLLKFHNATFKIVQNAIIRIFSSYLSTHSISTWPNLIQPKLNAEPHLFTTIFLTILHPFVFYQPLRF